MLVPPTAFIMEGTAACRAVSLGLVRNVGISLHTLRPVVIRRRTLLWISSARKSLSCIQLPASSAATLRPALVSGSAAVPLAAPSPTITTSTGFRLVAMTLLSGVAFPRGTFVERLPVRLRRYLHALIFRPHRHL